jgi:leader peptidase (prepilin peptidase) / N-methyltransferase
VENLPLVAIALIFVLSVPLVITDIKEHRLPNRLTYLAIAVSTGLVLISAILTQLWHQLLISLVLGGLTLGIGYLLAKVNGIGMGDVKFLVAVNAVLGWFSPWLILPMLAVGFSAASILSLALIMLRKANLRTAIPMGPFLVLGFLVVAIPLFEPVTTVAGGS